MTHDTLVSDLILAKLGYWDMLYCFRLIRSCGIRTPKLQNRTFESQGEIRILSSREMWIFAGFNILGLTPIQINGEFNSE